MANKYGTGRMRWMVIRHSSEDARHPVTVRLQVELSEVWSHTPIKSWEDVPVVDEYGNELLPHLDMPMWKTD